jgi:hypothetical protein
LPSGRTQPFVFGVFSIILLYRTFRMFRHCGATRAFGDCSGKPGYARQSRRTSRCQSFHLINLPPKSSPPTTATRVRCFLFLVIDATTCIGYHRCQSRVFGLPRESGGVFLEPFLSRLRWALARS